MSAVLPGGRAAKRRRRRPVMHYQARAASETTAEERFLQQAIQNSKLDKGRPPDGRLCIPSGPVFYPTQQDFEGNPLEYIEKIRPIAERYGICKIVPPAGWNPAPFCVDEHCEKRFQTKLQVLHRLQEGISYGDGVEYTISEYLQTASRRTQEWKAKYYPDHDLLSRHAEALEKKHAEEQEAEAAQIKGEQTDDKEPQLQTSSSSSSQAQQANSNLQKKLFAPANLERDFWDIVEAHTRQVTVEYGNDVDTATFGSGFPISERGRSVIRPPTPKNGDGSSTPLSMEEESSTTSEPAFGTPNYYRETYWNLNNIPNAPGSVLRYVKVGINGINVPWMYYGSLFTTFAYHNEDNYLYSINYHHRGAPKQWYGVPGNVESAEGLESVFKSYLSMKMRDVPDLLHHITTMFSPRLLQNADVPVCKLTQYEGEFVITFPRAFHGGFSYGPNIGEAVNFASHDWIQYGADANERYRSFARPAVFSHDRLTLTMANHFQDQTSYAACKLLLNELERVVNEEIELRAKLKRNGVRDVSHCIELPKNRVDQLDESSASYDDKRLCHACKHVCFFSAVACECSQSKVSCLRHAHFMCRCPPEKKYFMIWSPNEDLESTLKEVRTHCDNLKLKEKASEKKDAPESVSSEIKKVPLPQMGPGAEKDLLWHKQDEIPTGYLLDQKYKPCASIRKGHAEMEKEIESALARKRKQPDAVVSVSASSTLLNEKAFVEGEGTAVEVVEVRGPTGPTI
ncbi:hypothetical protein ACA910_000664 [Epithemia clementina (nom. ined.)]